jgi:hypothetical protein
MKLIRLRSIANNALRDSIWTPETIGEYPFEHVRPNQTIVIDLLHGKFTPDMEGDDIEKYYKAMSKWFDGALEKEGIPITVIESATITLTPEYRKCEIKAQGKTFTAKRAF